MGMKHTPGPWISEGQTVYSANGSEVCSTDNLAPETDAEAEANARLIAAAPELLELVERAESVISCLPYPENYLAADLRAVIAKAKGE